MNEILILETILKQNIIAFEDMEVHYGFKCIDSYDSKYARQYVIVQSAETNKLYKFYIKYNSMRKPYLSDDDDIKEVEQKDRTETIVYYQDVIRYNIR
jgi:hypothetical protein